MQKSQGLTQKVREVIMIFGDVVLERCVSYYRGLHFTACLEFLDTPVINSFDVANICGNKMITSMLLKKE